MTGRLLVVGMLFLASGYLLCPAQEWSDSTTALDAFHKSLALLRSHEYFTFNLDLKIEMSVDEETMTLKCRKGEAFAPDMVLMETASENMGGYKGKSFRKGETVLLYHRSRMQWLTPAEIGQRVPAEARYQNPWRVFQEAERYIERAEWDDPETIWGRKYYVVVLTLGEEAIRDNLTEDSELSEHLKPKDIVWDRTSFQMTASIEDPASGQSTAGLPVRVIAELSITYRGEGADPDVEAILNQEDGEEEAPPDGEELPFPVEQIFSKATLMLGGPRRSWAAPLPPALAARVAAIEEAERAGRAVNDLFD